MGAFRGYGLIAFASSLDRVGPFANSVKDTALMLRTIAGRDAMDSTSADVPVPDYVAELEKALDEGPSSCGAGTPARETPARSIKIGVAKEYFGSGLDAEVRETVEAAIQKLASLGCEIVPVSFATH